MNPKVEPGALAVASPVAFDLFLTLTVTTKSGPSSDTVREPLRRAARRDFAIRVYE
ncbi:hypothetical protein HPC49_47015 [Pyxidicoccus fallax]|uniref:Uncharacterized protein n=1 Tax=Pyxidicoccus fallax TaxID=394095 RepID=A0A848LUH3_9BACT|nr:hypothetical protein [Pyxidicoccus fallax]NMO21688.1 hypothetical protein [Pyxidicoccus fallax]NPC85730.1 hypothetical protein [Pyxidicoccus fallax]